MLEKCCNYSKQCCNNVATPCCAKNRRCESSRVLNRVTRTFLEVSRCSLANQRQRNVQKSVLHVQSSFFWLLNLLLFFHLSLCLCRLRWCYTRDDSQRRFLTQRILAMLEQCCNYSKQCRNNVVTPCCAKNRRCESSRVTSPLRTGRFATTILSASQRFNIVVTLFRIAAILFQHLKPVLR